MHPWRKHHSRVGVRHTKTCGLRRRVLTLCLSHVKSGSGLGSGPRAHLCRYVSKRRPLFKHTPQNLASRPPSNDAQSIPEALANRCLFLAQRGCDGSGKVDGKARAVHLKVTSETEMVRHMNTQLLTIDDERTRLLRDELRALRHAAARNASGAIVHRIYNCIQTAQSAISLVETDKAQDRPETIPMLLTLAMERLREGRTLLQHNGPILRPALPL